MKARKTTNHGSPAYVVQTTINGKRTKRFFKSKSAADSWIAKQKKVTASAGLKVAEVLADANSAGELAKAVALLEPYGKTLLQAAQHYVDAMEAAGASMTLREAVDELVKTRKRQGRSPRTVRELEQFLERFTAHTGDDTRLGTITTSQIENYLAGLEVSAASVNKYRQLLSSLFNFAEKRGWCASNPAASIEQHSTAKPLPGIFTAEQLQRMIATAPDAATELWVALGAWAGLRPSEVERLDWQHVHLEALTIDLQAVGTKTAQRRQVGILPPLAEVLTKHRQLAGPLVPEGHCQSRTFRKWKAALKFKWEHDGLRHSYGTYHLAAYSDAGKTALQMGHGGSPAVLFKHYVRPGITQAAARKFFHLPEPATPAAGATTTPQEKQA